VRLKSLERWFNQRRKSKVLELADRQLALAIETVNELENAIAAASKKEIGAAKKQLERLFTTEEEIDSLRRTIFEESTRGSLPLNDREDLMHLVKRLDVMADHVKDSGRSVLLLLEVNIPKELWNAYEEMAKDLVECAKVLKSSIEKLGTDPAEARLLSMKVDDVEKKADEKYLKIKGLLLKSDKAVTPPMLLLLKDMVESMEQVADTCDDTADYVRILTITKETS
jgi:predicted phosphate transport protein (TIGR00153 family)